MGVDLGVSLQFPTVSGQLNFPPPSVDFRVLSLVVLSSDKFDPSPYPHRFFSRPMFPLTPQGRGVSSFTLSDLSVASDSPPPLHPTPPPRTISKIPHHFHPPLVKGVMAVPLVTSPGVLFGTVPQKPKKHTHTGRSPAETFHTQFSYHFMSAGFL